MNSLSENNEYLSHESIEKFGEVSYYMELEIKKIIRDSKSIRVLVLGPTGSGKSSLVNTLIGNLPLIMGKKKAQLVCEGVSGGSKSCTRMPMIYNDHQNDLTYIDCAGFMDTEGFEQQIKNAFVLDYVLNDVSYLNNQIKILIVVSDSDIESLRGQVIVQIIEHLSKIFPDINHIQRAFNLVITKNDPELNGRDYIDILNEDPPAPIVDLIHFFETNIDHVFVFPIANKADIGKKYDFEDRIPLINSLKKDTIINPKHRIALDYKAQAIIEIMRKDHLISKSEKIKILCQKIGEQFRNEDNIKEMSKWVAIMNELLRKDIKNAKEFGNIINEFIPNSSLYDEDIRGLEEFELFDRFVDKIFGEQNTSCLKEVIQGWTENAIEELNKLIEYNEKIQEEKEKAIRERQEAMKKMEEESKNQYFLMTMKIQRLEEESKKRIQQLEDESRRKDEEMRIKDENARRIEENRRNAYEEDIRRMKKKIEEMQEAAQRELIQRNEEINRTREENARCVSELNNQRAQMEYCRTQTSHASTMLRNRTNNSYRSRKRVQAIKNRTGKSKSQLNSKKSCKKNNGGGGGCLLI